MDLKTSPEDCMAMAVESVGGNKTVGALLRPELDPVEAGKWLSRCLGDHAQRLNYGQERLLFVLACEQGAHDGFRAYAESIGYRVEPIDRRGEIEALARRAEQLAKQSAELSNEAMARMQAAGLKVGDL